MFRVGKTLCRRSNLRVPRRQASTNVPESAEVVIIGGSFIGCSTLYHLSKRGCRAVLLEKDRLAAGTSSHTAGDVWRLQPNDTDIQLLNYTRYLLKNVLEKESGLSPGWIGNGGLFVASKRQRLEEYKRLKTIGKVFGVESHILTPAATKKMFPLLNVDDMYGCLYSPGDGTVDPSKYCAALTKVAVDNGAIVKEQCPVLDIETEVDDFGCKRIKGVKTPFGLISTSRVVNCSGLWAPKIGAMVGAAVPLMTARHSYITTVPIPGIANMPNVRDHDLSLYFRIIGDTMAVGGYEKNPEFIEKTPEDFARSLFDSDTDIFDNHLKQGVQRCPTLATTGIESKICGPESFTPDHKPLLGEDTVVRGFFHGCETSSWGMSSSGGCGRELANWIIDGRPQLDMYAYDIRRFSSRTVNDTRWLRERSHEAYAKNYSIIFPHDEPLSARPMAKDPLFEDLLNEGCVYEERHGFERPGWFSRDGRNELLEYDFHACKGFKAHERYKYAEKLAMDYTFDFPKQHHMIREEALACREHVAIFNMSYFGKFFLYGPDAQKAAEWLCTNSVEHREGSTMYTCMLNKNGGVEGELTFSVIKGGTGKTPADPTFSGPGFYIAACGASTQQAWTHIRQTIEDEKLRCHLLDHSTQMGLLSIQGPQSRELLSALTSADLSDAAFPLSTHQMIDFAGHSVRALRQSFVGELGWELHVPNDGLLDVYRTIVRAGEKFGLRNAGYRAVDSLSLEKGSRYWHADVRMDDTPLEAGLDFVCKLKESTPFLGRNALERQQSEGLKKRIACFTVDEHVPLLGLETIYRDGEIVGFIRRADFGFALNKSIGYGYLKNPSGEAVSMEWLISGDYQIERRGVLLQAKLHTRSPFDPLSNRVKGIY